MLTPSCLLRGSVRRTLGVLILLPLVFALLIEAVDDGLSCRNDDSSAAPHGSGEKRHKIYHVLAAPPCEAMAQELVESYPDRFIYHATSWDKFPDGTDLIQIGGYKDPTNVLANQHVLFLASFHNNDATWSQFQAFIYLLQSSFLVSLTIVLPYYPVGTMERVDVEDGTIPTAVTYAHVFSTLPKTCAKPTHLITYDLHTLQNRFYFHDSTIASLETALPLLAPQIMSSNMNGVAFPDDGAAKRFGPFFANQNDLEIVVCRKTRGSSKIKDIHKRTVDIQAGNALGRRVVVVDDLVQTGGTLYECCKALKHEGALSVSAFVTHAVFPSDSWKRFLREGDFACFERFWVTNSVPTTTNKLPTDNVFEVLDLTELVVQKLYQY